MHRAISTVAISKDILVATDMSGIVHCLDAKTGKQHWSHDLFAACWNTPLIVDGKVYVADEDGKITIFQLSAKKNLIRELQFNNSAYSSAVSAGNVLYFGANKKLHAITNTDSD